MMLPVTETSFVSEIDWLFKLSNGKSDYYIFDDTFYKRNKMKSPIRQNNLDNLDIGDIVDFEFEIIESYNAVIKVNKTEKIFD